jgi:hypothetical protein
MNRALVGLSLAVGVALVPAAAGAGPPKALGLTAAPARVAFRGGGSASVRLRNPSEESVVVDVASVGLALDLRGQPRIVRRPGSRSASRWLTLRPAHFTLAPHTAARLLVVAKVPTHAEPGDHDAIVLLSGRPRARARVSIRLRLGVVVVVRAPGAVTRRLRLRGLRLTRREGRRALELVVVNAGNVTERLLHVRAILSRLSSRRRVAIIVASVRDLRPVTRGLLEFRLRTSATGPVTARVVVPAEPGRRVLRRTYRLRI